MSIFFNHYENSGVGISKNAPKKKGLALFLDIVGRKFWKLMEINLLYMLFYFPLIMIVPAISLLGNNETAAITAIVILMLVFMILIGPATAGMTKVIRCFVIEKHTFVIRDFFKGFKENFKKASIIGFVNCLVILSAYASLLVYPALANQISKAMFIPMVITFSLFLVIIIMNYYIFPMMIATNLSMKNLLKNSFALSFVALKQNIISFVCSLVILILMLLLGIYLLPVFSFIIAFFPAAFICLLTLFNVYPVIQKYVINPYYTSIGEINPELTNSSIDENDEERIFTDMGGLEKPIEKRKKNKGKRIS